MVTIDEFRKLALSFPDATEEPHFEITSFRINKKIFATLNAEKKWCTVRLTQIDQSVFSAFDNTIIFPVPNRWGLYGWTHIMLGKVRKSVLKDALSRSYAMAAPKPKKSKAEKENKSAQVKKVKKLKDDF